MHFVRKLPIFNNLKLRTNYITIRLKYANAAKIDITGKHLVHPLDFKRSEYNSLIWTVLDLKERFKVTSGKPMPVQQSPHVENHRIALILNKPCMGTQMSIGNAAKLLHATVNVIVYPNWHLLNLKDFGRLIGLSADLILIDAPQQNKAEKLSAHTKSGVVVLKSCQQMILQAFTDLVTAHIHFGTLRNRILALIGEPSPLFNSYMLLAPMFGVNINYFTCGKQQMPMSMSSLHESEVVSIKRGMLIKECSTLENVMGGANMIATNVEELTFSITKEHFKTAASDLVFLHCMRKWCELFVEDHFLTDNANKQVKDLHWPAICNFQWILAAIILRMLKNHEHKIPNPDWLTKKKT